MSHARSTARRDCGPRNASSYPSRGTSTVAVVALLLVHSLGCSPSTPSKRRRAAPTIQVQVLNTFPHDAGAFTQGLEIENGTLYESTGIEGSSTLRKVDLNSGQVELSLKLDTKYFGEGLTILGNRIYQLTYKSRTCFVYEKATFEALEHFTFNGEGWGLANDGKQLFMSSGNSTIEIRDPESFEVVRELRVKDGRKSIIYLNELEYFDGHLFANVLGEDRIAKIEPSSGKVVAWLDCSHVYPAPKRDDASRQVLNGIAHDADTGRTFITGKNWPSLFEIRIADD